MRTSMPADTATFIPVMATAASTASMTPSLDAGQLAALLHLSSPALPIGGFSYS